MPKQQALTPRRQEVTQVMPYQQQVLPPRCAAPKPSATPMPVSVMRSWPGRMKVPGVGPHLKGPETDNEETDPPPEDPGNAGGAS